MAVVMVGSLLILAAAAAASQPAIPARTSGANRPKISASAHATARIQIISGVKFGQDFQAEPAGAGRRQASLADADGQARPVELLEFQ